MNTPLRIAVTVACFLLNGTVQLVAQESNTNRPSHRQPLAQFDIAKDGDLLLLPVMSNGRRLTFVLDTGSDLTVFDRSLLFGEPKKTVTLQTLSGERLVELFAAPKALVGGLSLQDGALVLASDLQMMRQISGYDIRGIIGMDFLRNYVVQLDIAFGKVYFLNRVEGNLGQRVPVWRQPDGHFVDVWVSGLDQAQRFLIDTGSMPCANIKKELAASVAKRGKAKQVGVAMTGGLAGTARNTRWLVESIRLGCYEQRNTMSIGSAHNVLGLGFWAGCTVTFDFPNSVMYVKAAENRPVQRNDADLSGLHLLRIDGKVVVHSVDNGSPAAFSGLRPRDVILKVGETQTDQVTMLAIRRLLCAEDTRLSIVVERGGISAGIPIVLGNLQVRE